MKKAAELDMAIVAHCEENTLINKGSVHEGDFSVRNGLNGIPSVCESVHIARDVLLAEAANCHYHVCHISTKIVPSEGIFKIQLNHFFSVLKVHWRRFSKM